MMSRFLSITALCAVLFVACSAKPTEVVSNPGVLNPLQHQLMTAVETDSKRHQRSPQFGFPEGGFLEGGFPEPGFGNQYGDRYENRPRHHNKHHHRPIGCRQFGCGGGGYEPAPPFFQGGRPSESEAQASAGTVGGPFGGGSLAQANAESGGLNGPFGGDGESQASAQSGSFNFGPVSASFSLAESSSGGQRF